MVCVSWLGGVGLSLLFVATVLEAIDAGIGSNDQLVAGQGGRGHAHVVFEQLVGIKQLEFATSFEDVGYAVFVEVKDFSVGCPR